MTRRKLSKADYKALNRGAPVGVRYPPASGRAEIRVPSRERRRRRRKPDNEGG